MHSPLWHTIHPPVTLLSHARQDLGTWPLVHQAVANNSFPDGDPRDPMDARVPRP